MLKWTHRIPMHKTPWDSNIHVHSVDWDTIDSLQYLIPPQFLFWYIEDQIVEQPRTDNWPMNQFRFVVFGSWWNTVRSQKQQQNLVSLSHKTSLFKSHVFRNCFGTLHIRATQNCKLTRETTHVFGLWLLVKHYTKSKTTTALGVFVSQYFVVQIAHVS